MEPKIEGKLQPKFRMIMLGCKGVGKTSLINQFVNNNFRSDYYPTKDLIIYKKLYNFTPNSGDIDDFCYIEIIDSMAYDRSKNLKDFCEFFTVHLVNERDISKSNPNSKIPDSILKNIKHEYISSKDGNSIKGLFSNDKIMAYIFVFDYSDDRSLDEMLELYYAISTDESLKVQSENLKTIKCFVCNKYPIMIEDVPDDIAYSEVIKGYADKDKRTGEIISRIQRKLIDRQLDKNKIDYLYFTSTKNNLGVNNCFNSIFNKIKHKDDIYTKILCEEENNNEEEEEEDEQNKSEEIQTGFFCCKKTKKVMEDKSLNKSQFNQSYHQDKLNFRDDDEEPGYDINVRIRPKSKEKKEEGQKKDNSSCLVY